MPDENKRYYEMRRIGAIFACACFALLAGLLWWIWVDRTPAWREHQEGLSSLRAALTRLDDLAAADRSGDRSQSRPVSDSRRETISIRQVVLPEVRRDLHFAESATIDRCMTCHAAIDAADLGPWRLALRLARAHGEKAGRTPESGSGGSYPPQPPLVKRGSEMGDAKGGSDELLQGMVGDIDWLWPMLDEDRQKSLLDAAVDAANRRLGGAGAGPIAMRQPIEPHPDLELYVADRSPHPMKQMGCTVCHQGSGDETDFMLAGHTAESAAMLAEWKEQHQVRRAGVATEYGYESARANMERPMLPSRCVEAGCAKCHPQISDTAVFDCRPLARDLNAGRILVERWGCVNCHLIEGFESSPRVGPSLVRAGAKLDGGFMRQYILSPMAFRPWTAMPHSFEQENSVSLAESGAPEAANRRIRSVIDAMVLYLQLTRQGDVPGLPPETSEALANPDIVKAAAERGRRLFNEIGCLACHPPIDEKSGPYGSIGIRPAAGPATEPAFSKTPPGDHAVKDDVEVLFEMPPEPGPVAVRFAPDLSNLGAKFANSDVEIAWLRNWLIDPRQYSPATRMPRFRLDVPSASSPAGVPQITDQAGDLAVYLNGLPARRYREETPPAWQADDDALRAVRDDLIRQTFPDTGGDENTEIGSQLAAGFSEKTTGSRGVAALTADERRWAYLGQRMLAHYGCAGCHEIPGLEDAPRIGPELSGWANQPVGQLDLGMFDPLLGLAGKDARFSTLYPEGRKPPWVPDNPAVYIERTHASFAWYKLRNPRIWERGRDKPLLSRLRMPNFYMSGDRAGDLATFVLSRQEANVEASLMADRRSPAGRAAPGTNLTRSLNCTACHTIEGSGAAILQYYWRREGGAWHFQTAEAPPRMAGQGSRVEAQWTHDYMGEVKTIRPWLTVRMPSFALDEQQIAVIAEYYSAVSEGRSQWLDERLTATAKWSLPGQDSYAGSEGAREDSRTSESPGPSPDVPQIADLLGGAAGDGTDRYAAVSAIDSIRRFILLHGSIPANWLEPLESSHETFVKACDQAVSDAGFLKQVYGISHAFLDPSAPQAGADQIADGRTIFQELQCLQCHVFGDPTVPGANEHPTAPDLQRVSGRLRPAWVPLWLRGPRRIQTGTRMPDFFGDGQVSAFADYEASDRAVVQARLRNKSLLDDGPGQIQAIVNFVYDASSRRITVVREAETQAAE